MGRRKKAVMDPWRKDRQDPETKRQMEIIGEVVTIGSVGIAFGFMILRTWYWLVGCILSLIVIVALVVLFPDYFTLIEEKKEETKYGISLDLPLAVDAMAMVVGQGYNLDIWWQPVPWAVAITVIVVALLVRFSRDFRTAWNTALAVVCSFAISCFLVCQMNVYLDFSQPEHTEVTVLELHSSSHRRGRTYACTVALDGEPLRIDVSRKTYNQLEQGVLVCLDTHKGALGMAFRNVHLIEE